MKILSRWTVQGLLLFIGVACVTTTVQKDYPIVPVSFTDVHFNDSFWLPRIETNRKVTIPRAFEKCEETGRIDNFSKAGGLMGGEYCGVYPFDDTDIYKTIEGASYSLSIHPDPELEKYLDTVIAKIAVGQEEDGYLYTWRTIDPKGASDWGGPTRWSNVGRSHELYNAGHLFEAASAHYQATGKRNLLEVALKFADLIDSVFGSDKKHDTPGHPVIEMGLAKLYRITGKEEYLELAKFFLNQRGRHENRKSYGEYHVDHKPVFEQDEAVGHAVRAAYLYSGMADVGALTGDTAYIRAIDRLWDNVVTKKLYLTGGIGAIGNPGRARGETFGQNYELPNLTAYNETCAAIGNAFWNYRMFLLHGDAKYLDVFERVLYNCIISGVSLEGDTFFYPNPLESDGKYAFNDGALTRKEWFECACCTGNIARFLPSIPGYVYAHRDDILYVNLFIEGSAIMKLTGQAVAVQQQTRYPWDGAVKIIIDPVKSGKFAVYVRIPGWARNKPVPSGLYRYVDESGEEPLLKVNGESIDLYLEKGFARIRRYWRPGDVIELDLPMPVRRVLSHNYVKDNIGKVALERGPIVYCAEWVDNGGKVLNLLLPDESELQAEYREDLLKGLVVVKGKALAMSVGKDSQAVKKEQDFTAIPYYAWSHRGVGEMAVWLARAESAVKFSSRN